jgi:ankyrin repeat protein
MDGMFGVIGGSVEIGGEGFTLYFSSSSLSVVLSLCFPMHTHTHTHSTRYILTASSSYPHPSTPLITQDDYYKHTALMYAAMGGHVEAVKALVAADPDLAHLNMKVSVP